MKLKNILKEEDHHLFNIENEMDKHSDNVYTFVIEKSGCIEGVIYLKEHDVEYVPNEDGFNEVNEDDYDKLFDVMNDVIDEIFEEGCELDNRDFIITFINDNKSLYIYFMSETN